MKFNGDRLISARVFRNITISDLANKVKVSKQAISQYEKGIITPKPDVLFSIVKTLKFPVSYFMEEDSYNININNTFFRALGSARTLDLKTQKVKTSFVVKIYNFLLEFLNLPKLDLPDFATHDIDKPEVIANVLRRYWRLGNRPIPNMVNLLEKKGVIVSSFNTNVKNIDAFMQVHNVNKIKQYCVILGKDKKSMVRRNFDAAHELGHIVMHNDLINIGDLTKPEFKKVENEANQFAASFLLPKEAFYLDLVNPTDLDYYILLKKKWKVSIASMVVRAKQLNRINASQYQSLMKKISYRKWRKNEPYDDIWELNNPQLFKKSFQILIENNVLSIPDIINQLSKHDCSMYSEDIEELLDLEKGSLSISENNYDDVVISLKFNEG